MLYTFHFFGGMNWALSAILLLLFCATANCYVVISGWLWFSATQTSFLSSAPVKLLLFPLIFSVLHSLIPTLFPWNMGYPWFWGGLWGAQTAELWGFRFLNTLFYIFNLLFLIVYYHFYKDRSSVNVPSLDSSFIDEPSLDESSLNSSSLDKPSLHNSFLDGLFIQLKNFFVFMKNPVTGKSFLLNENVREKNPANNQNSLRLFFSRFSLDGAGVKALSGAVFLFVFLNGLGFYLKKRLPAPDSSLNVIVIQHNISSKGEDPKPFKNLKQKAFYNLRNLTYSSLKQARKDKLKTKDIDFILWPEGAYPYTINKKKNRTAGLSKLVKTINIPLITGAITRERNYYSNSLVAFDREGNILQPIYDKMKLVIFGEYFPFIDKWSFLKKLFPYFGSNLLAGTATQAQKLEDKKIGWQICYEALFDDLSRASANKGAQIIVNVTNDSWYGSWQEPYQHLAMGLARAIEIRRPVIRSTNTGFSGVAHANGAVPPYSPMNKAWFYRYKIPYYKNPPQTLFMGWGYYINEIFLSLMLFFVIALALKSSRF